MHFRLDFNAKWWSLEWLLLLMYMYKYIYM